MDDASPKSAADSPLGAFIRDQRRSARLSIRKLSGLAHISNPYLSQIERGLRRPSAEILQQLAKALRISAESLYIQAGILEQRSDLSDGGVVEAIWADATLVEAQKRALLQVYRSFQRENGHQNGCGEDGGEDGGEARKEWAESEELAALRR